MENLPVPFDLRVWRESLALKSAGYRVSVIAPRDPRTRQPARELLDGIAVYRYSPRHANEGLFMYGIEYLVAVIMTAWLMVVVLRREGFDVVQICNPPDLLILAAAPFKLLGKRVVFDQHDVCPEIYMAQKELPLDSSNPMLTALKFFEKLTYKWADLVLVVNESCRRIAMSRGRKPASEVYVVRNGPTEESLRDVEPDWSIKDGRRFLLGYVGMMGKQDGIDVLLRVIAHLFALRPAGDFTVRIMGGGPMLEPMKAYSAALGINGLVTFTGTVPHEDVLTGVSSSDICLCPDPKTPLSNICSLVKAVEYMCLGKPFVAFDLDEVRGTAGDAALYATPGDEHQFAQLVHQLLEDEAIRLEMGQRARLRALGSLTWDHSVGNLLQAYDRVFDGSSSQQNL